jgi:hypothetical protein
VVEILPSKHEAQSSTLNNTHTRKSYLEFFVCIKMDRFSITKQSRFASTPAHSKLFVIALGKFEKYCGLF